MAKRSVPPRPVVRDGLVLLGQLIHEARLARTWTRADLAERADVSAATVAKIEAGAPGTAIGTVFSVADLVGVPLFGINDPVEMARRRRLGEERLALLPSRVWTRRLRDINDDF